MLFNSFEFILFFIVVYSIYLKLGRKMQNRLLLIASYFFYGAWDWRFLSLIWISTIVDYLVGKRLENTVDVKIKKRLVAISVTANLALLATFKYFNFFADNFVDLFNSMGLQLSPVSVKIILPVGISFYTFQTISYSIDIYRGKVKAVKNIFDFALFVAFFPQLVAGPIERAHSLIPQLLSRREIKFKQVYEGLWLFVWGLFKKIVVADNIAKIVNTMYASSDSLTAPEVILAAYAFAVQIYCDFSGYSDIARAVAKMMGIELMVNFNLPFFATNPSDFWRRWHISLSTWLRDYLYIPLGGNQKGRWKTYRNLMQTMILGGLWHGASWIFVVWGIYQGLCLSIHRLYKESKIGMRLPTVLSVFITFNLMALGWLIFRSQDFTQFSELLHNLIFNWKIDADFFDTAYRIMSLSWVLITVQFIQYYQNEPFFLKSLPSIAQTAIFAFILNLMWCYAVLTPEKFIYFQF